MEGRPLFVALLMAALGAISDFTEIAACGVMSTPGLVVDEQVVSSGRVPNKPKSRSCCVKQPAAEALVGTLTGAQ